MTVTGTYHDGALAQPCDIALSEGSLHIYLHDKTKDLRIWKLKSVNARLSGNTLTLEKAKDPHQYIECRGEMAQLIYSAWANPKPEPPKSRIAKRVYIFFFTFIALLLLMGLLAYFYALPWVAEKAVVLIPTRLEVELGESLASVYTQQNSTNDSANYFMGRFVKQLDLDNDYKLKVEVLESPEMNAFSLPGGRIFIYSGLLEKMNSYEELAALLGHEATHVIHRHSLKSIFRGAASGMVIAAVFGNASELSPWILSKADEFRQLNYSRELETEADDNGVDMMVENNIDPKGMLALLSVLKAGNTQEPGLMKYLSTHPDVEARIENVSAKPELKNKFPEHKELAALFQEIKQSLKKY